MRWATPKPSPCCSGSLRPPVNRITAAPLCTSTATRQNRPRITHFVDRSGEFEKLETLDGPRREIIRNSSEIVTFYADSGVVKRERRTARKVFPALLPDQLSVLTEYYQLRKAGQDRIAGHDAQALILEPRDQYRYGHKLWAEIKTGLLLKARMLNEKGEVMEQFHFTEVSIGVPMTKDSVMPGFAMPAPPQRETAQAPTDTGWAVQNQPAGLRRSWRCSGRSKLAGARYRTWCSRTGLPRCPYSSSRCLPRKSSPACPIRAP